MWGWVWAVGMRSHEFSKWSPSWKYAGNWKGHTCFKGMEGFLRRATTVTCLKQRNSALAEWAVSQLSYQHGEKWVRVLRPTWPKIVILETFFLATVLKKVNQTQSVSCAVCPWCLHVASARHVYCAVVQSCGLVLGRPPYGIARDFLCWLFF